MKAAVTPIRMLAIAFATSILVAACGKSGPGGPVPTATISGVVRDNNGAVVVGASVSIGSRTATTGADGRFELQNVKVGSVTMITSAPDFDPRSQTVNLTAGSNTLDVVLS